MRMWNGNGNPRAPESPGSIPPRCLHRVFMNDNSAESLSPAAHDSRNALVQSARTVIAIEAAAICSLEPRIDGAFSEACKRIMHCNGRVVVSGMGKSGHIAHKVAATL